MAASTAGKPVWQFWHVLPPSNGVKPGQDAAHETIFLRQAEHAQLALCFSKCLRATSRDADSNLPIPMANGDALDGTDDHSLAHT